MGKTEFVLPSVLAIYPRYQSHALYKPEMLYSYLRGLGCAKETISNLLWILLHECLLLSSLHDDGGCYVLCSKLY